MDYQEIHDSFISFARCRVNDPDAFCNNGVANSMFIKNPGQGWKIGRMKGVK